MNSFTEQHYWNTHSYGRATRIRARHIRASIMVVCLLTPFTNWLIPFIHQIVQEDVVLRRD